MGLMCLIYYSVMDLMCFDERFNNGSDKNSMMVWMSLIKDSIMGMMCLVLDSVMGLMSLMSLI